MFRHLKLTKKDELSSWQVPRNPEYSDLSCSSCLESSLKAAILGYPATAEVGKSTFISCMVEALVVPLKSVFRSPIRINIEFCPC